MECYTNADTQSPKECQPLFNDYFECLHGYKEREKVRLQLKQLRENEANGSGVTAKDLFKATSSGRYENLDLVK